MQVDASWLGRVVFCSNSSCTKHIEQVSTKDEHMSTLSMRACKTSQAR